VLGSAWPREHRDQVLWCRERSCPAAGAPHAGSKAKRSVSTPVC